VAYPSIIPTGVELMNGLICQQTTLDLVYGGEGYQLLPPQFIGLSPDGGPLHQCFHQ